MIHLLLGLKPEYIRIDPYTPTLYQVPRLSAQEIGIGTYPLSAIDFAPSVGSYVGGDITSGLLCTDLASDSENISLFIDIGTNGELVVGNRDFLTACACSAGPAFEGGGIEWGTRAVYGAIDKVTIDPAVGKVHYSTIGNGTPCGICGSGMISLIAELFLTGLIDQAGKLDRSRSTPLIQQEGRRARFLLVSRNESRWGDPISISETEIESTIRAKAAIYSACCLMLDQIGIGFSDLEKVYIAGGFGRFLEIENAIVIGLLPDIPRHRFKYIGNASLWGSYLALMSKESREQQESIYERMTYLELNTDPAYMDQYTGALFLPHTDLNRFPSLKKLSRKIHH